MPLFGRHRKKDSRSPSPERTPTRLKVSDRLRPLNSKADTFLPMAYQSSTVSPGNNMCNQFLLGGNYYPGKDKRRKHLRKKTLWYRVFCSTPLRGFLTALFLGYLVVFQSILPFVGHSNVATESTVEPGVHVPNIMEEKRRVKQLRLDIDYGITRQRHKILDKIVPKFLHRNDGVHMTKNQRERSKKNPKRLRKQSGPNAPPDSVDPKQKSKKQKVLDSKKVEPKRGPRLEKESKGVALRSKSASHKASDAAPSAGSRKKYPRARSGVERSSLPQEKSPIVKHIQQRVTRTLRNMDELKHGESCPLLQETISTTLVTQTSLDRIWILEETCSRWKDPIVVVVAVVKEQLARAETLMSGIREACLHLTFYTHAFEGNENSHDNYPVNHLRNVGLDLVKTSHVLVMDVDFVPSVGLADRIRVTVEQRNTARSGDNHGLPSEDLDAIVIPAFERVLDPPCATDADCKAHLRGNSSFIPRTFDELHSCVDQHSCAVFQQKVNWEGHHSTKSEEWMAKQWFAPNASSNDFVAIREITCFDSVRYEPYVVLRWCPTTTSRSQISAPYYDERFHGYGKNKIELVSHLRLGGWRFSVLPEEFIVHHPHAESAAKRYWLDTGVSGLHRDMDRLYPRFLEELVEKYRDSDHPVIGMCK